MSFLELPSQTQALIVATVTVALNLLIQFVSTYVPWLGGFLQKYAQEWAIAISVAVVVWLQNVLPGAEYADLSLQAVTLVFTALLLWLSRVVLARAGVRGFA